MQTEIDLESRLEELPDLLPFPAVATKLMNVANSSSVSIRDMCRIIECDASLSMELLRIANSPIYGCGGQVRTIEQAGVELPEVIEYLTDVQLLQVDHRWNNH